MTDIEQNNVHSIDANYRHVVKVLNGRMNGDIETQLTTFKCPHSVDGILLLSQKSNKVFRKLPQFELWYKVQPPHVKRNLVDHLDDDALDNFRAQHNHNQLKVWMWGGSWLLLIIWLILSYLRLSQILCEVANANGEHYCLMEAKNKRPW